MFFILSKTAAFLLMPSNVLLLLCLAGLGLAWTRLRRTGLALAAGSLVLLLVAGFSPIGTVLLHLLEARFPQWDARRGAPDGIIILGGAVSPNLSRIYGEPIVNGHAGRILAIGRLARDYPNARIVYSGGDASLTASGEAETNALPPLLAMLGLPRDRVILEGRSRNTEENATFSRDLVKPKAGERWLVVTSAWHMPRAIGCFRAAGFDVEAYPVSWRTGKSMPGGVSVVFGYGLAATDFAAHEWIGLLAYRLTGRTSELLPGPR